MAELLGVAASIIALASLGVNISKQLYNIGSKARGAEANINRIATNVTLFSFMLKHLARVLQDAQSLHSAEALELTDRIVHECNTIFDEIGKMGRMALMASSGQSGIDVDARGLVEPDAKKRRLGVLQRMKWHFEQPRVEWLLAQLEYLKTTLSVLIQTLNLAAVTAKAKDSDPKSVETDTLLIVEERKHVETLVVASQLAVILVRERAEEAGIDPKERIGVVSPEGSESSQDLPETGPKLLTQGSSNSLSMVRHGTGELEFLDRTMARSGRAMFPMLHASEECVDELLSRWTRLSEKEAELSIPQKTPDTDLEEQAVEEPAPRRSIDCESQEETARCNKTPPDLQLQLVESPSEVYELAGVAAASISDQWLDPSSPLKSAFRNGSAYSFNIPRPPSQQSLGSRPISKLAISHKTSSPSPEAPPEHRLSRVPSPARDSRSTTDRSSSLSYPYIPPPPIAATFTNNHMVDPIYPNTWHDVRPIVQPPTSRPRDTAHQPYVSSPTPTESSCSSRSASPTPDEQRRNSGVGLGIPWRIRVSPTKYFDFLDTRLVGPRTPYLPTEPLPWVYKQAQATTEIASAWVCEEAIVEKKMPYSEIAYEDRESKGNSTWKAEGRPDQEPRWRIMWPLKFDEIEHLVERTIQIYRQRTATPAVASQQRRQQQPLPPCSRQMPQGPQGNQPVASSQPRSVSFSSLPPQTRSNRSSADSNWPGGPPALAPGTHNANAYYSPSSPRSAEWGERERGRGDGRDRDRDLFRDIPPSRSGRSHKSLKEGKEREKEKRRAMGRRAAGTIATLGGLAALLEGLDAL